ncbi:MAG TPA: flagellar protein FlgN [Clostridiales bacterium]|nr:flagellar protein FlgN [Clostridiales bacterium]
MSKYVEQLIEILNREYEGYTEYSKLAEEKQKVILSGDVKALDKIVEQEQEWVVMMGKMEQVRKIIIGNILLENNVERVENITELSEYIPEPQRTELLKIREDLGKLLEKIQEINELNGKLIQQTLDYIHFHINVLTGAESGTGTYGNRADGKDIHIQQKRNLFDAKV